MTYCEPIVLELEGGKASLITPGDGGATPSPARIGLNSKPKVLLWKCLLDGGAYSGYLVSFEEAVVCSDWHSSHGTDVVAV